MMHFLHSQPAQNNLPNQEYTEMYFRPLVLRSPIRYTTHTILFSAISYSILLLFFLPLSRQAKFRICDIPDTLLPALLSRYSSNLFQSLLAHAKPVHFS